MAGALQWARGTLNAKKVGPVARRRFLKGALVVCLAALVHNGFAIFIGTRCSSGVQGDYQSLLVVCLLPPVPQKVALCSRMKCTFLAHMCGVKGSCFSNEGVG